MAPYQNLKKRSIGNNNSYLLNSNKEYLLIFLNGSGMNSVLGERKGGIWRSVEFSYFICKYYGYYYDIAIPKKPDFSLGKNYEEDANKLSNYTVDGLVTSYTNTINDLLRNGKYKKTLFFLVFLKGDFYFLKSIIL